MINTDYLIIYLLFVHFVSDFVLQTNWMAQNKSKNIIALLVHIVVYSIATLSLISLSVNVFHLSRMEWVLFYVGVNGALHLLIDMITSQFTSYFWKKGDVHNFFVVVGFDQFLHTAIIVLTYNCCCYNI